MIFQTHQVRGFILAYMETRCSVSSQHKLPGREEILDCTFVQFTGLVVAELVLDTMIADGTLRKYGPYLSDREIDVL